MIIQKTEFTTDITNILSGLKLVRNDKAKTFNYVAKLKNYESAHNIDREFEKDITDLENNKTEFNLAVSTSFLNNLRIGEILEVKVNLRHSNRYSRVSCSYLVVINNLNNTIELTNESTALKAFKASKMVLNVEAA